MTCQELVFSLIIIASTTEKNIKCIKINTVILEDSVKALDHD